MKITKWLEKNFDGDKETALFVLNEGVKHFTFVMNGKHNSKAERAAAKKQLAETKKYIAALA